MWRGLCPRNTLWAPSLQQKDAIEHAHIPQWSASCDCFSQEPKCTPVCLSSGHPPPSYGCWSSEAFPLFHFLFLNKRAVVIRAAWSRAASPGSGCIGAVTSAAFLAGQCGAVSSAQYPCSQSRRGAAVGAASGGGALRSPREGVGLAALPWLPGSCRKDFEQFH